MIAQQLPFPTYAVAMSLYQIIKQINVMHFNPIMLNLQYYSTGQLMLCICMYIYIVDTHEWAGQGHIQLILILKGVLLLTL